MNPLVEKYETGHKDLLEKWRSEHESRGYTDFIYDGIVNPNLEEWFNQEERVLFILKEGYNKENPGHPTSLVEELRDSNKRVSRIWKNVCKWYYCLKRVTAEHIPSYEDAVAASEDCMDIEKCAVINIKKSNGVSESDPDNLRGFVKEDYEHIRDQIAYINPTIIVCGYTFHLLKDYNAGKNIASYGIFSCDTSNELDNIGCYDINGRLVISYYHPSNHYPNLLNYYGFAGMYRDYLLRHAKQI